MTDDNVVASLDKLREGIIEVHPEGKDSGASISEVVVDLWTTKSEGVRENTLIVAASMR